MSTSLSLEKIQLAKGHPPIACVDIGGTKVAVTVIDDHGKRGRVVEPTAKTGERDALAQQIIHMIVAACELGEISVDDISAVGVASCGPFVIADGCVELAAPNICGGIAGDRHGLPNTWETAILEAPLKRRFPGVRVENDGMGGEGV